MMALQHTSSEYYWTGKEWVWKDVQKVNFSIPFIWGMNEISMIQSYSTKVFNINSQNVNDEKNLGNAEGSGDLSDHHDDEDKAYYASLFYKTPLPNFKQ